MDEIVSAILKSIMELEGKKIWKLVAWVIVILGIVLAPISKMTT